MQTLSECSKMKPPSLKESRELEIAAKKAELIAANKDAARDMLLSIVFSLPRNPLPSNMSIESLERRQKPR